MFKINDIVKLKKYNTIGKIIRISDNNRYFTILLDNNSKIKVFEKDIELIETNNKVRKNKVSIKYTPIENSFENEIMIRHQTVLEAIENVDRFISSAIMHKEKRLRIIHGRHGGILRNAVHEYLSTSPYVDTFKLADVYEGSIGVTIVYLK